jgi:hypothetical protein
MVLADVVRRPVAAPRRWRVVRSLLVVLFVGMLSTGVVAASGPASADDAVGVLVKEGAKVLGGTAAAGTVEEVATGSTLVCATGVGCLVLGAAAVGIGLYATKDVWLPWLENHFSDPPNSGLGVPVSIAQITDADVDQAPGGVVSLTMTNQSADSGGESMAETLRIWCKQTQFNPEHYGVPVGGVATEDKAMNFYFAAHESKTWGTQCTGMGQLVRVQTLPSADNHSGAALNQVEWNVPGQGVDDTFHATVECVGPDGSTVQLTGPDSTTADGGVQLPSCAAAGLGSHAKSATVTGTAPGSPPQTVWSVVPPDHSSDYPQCDAAAATVCQFDVTYKGQRCTVGMAGCTDWARRSQTNTTDYGCLWGPYTLPLSSCHMQERAYETGTQTGVDATPANTDGDPNTATDVNGDPMEGGDPVPDAPTAEPSPSPSTSVASPTPSPTISGPTDPRIPPGDQATANVCWPNGWSAFNPASWVLMPVKCALKWAFVPSGSAIQTSLDGVTGVWNASSWGKWAGAIGGLGSSLSSAPPDDCRGPGLDVNASWVGVDKTVYPFDSCSGAAATVAGIIRDGVSCALVAAGALACVRLLMAGLSYGGFSGGGGGE